MVIEYSNEEKGKVWAYRFSKWEMKRIADSLKPTVKKLQKQIEKIKNHPENEGQVKYQIQIDELQAEVEILNDTIKEFET